MGVFFPSFSSCPWLSSSATSAVLLSALTCLLPSYHPVLFLLCALCITFVWSTPLFPHLSLCLNLCVPPWLLLSPLLSVLTFWFFCFSLRLPIVSDFFFHSPCLSFCFPWPPVSFFLCFFFFSFSLYYFLSCVLLWELLEFIHALYPCWLPPPLILFFFLLLADPYDACHSPSLCSLTVERYFKCPNCRCVLGQQRSINEMLTLCEVLMRDSFTISALDFSVPLLLLSYIWKMGLGR